MPKTSSIRSSVSIEHRLVTDGRRHGLIAMASRGKNWPIATVVTAKCSTLVAPANLLFWTQKPAITFYTPLTFT